VANGYLYEIGGQDTNFIRDTVYYAKLNADGTIGSWAATTSINVSGSQPRIGATSVVANGYLYEIGGYDGTYRDTVYYAKLNADGTIGSWAATNPINVASVSQPRYRASSVTANGYVYVIGGLEATLTTKDTVYYAKLNADGTIGSWAATTSINVSGSQPRANATGIIANGYIYVIGGYGALSNSLDTVYYASTPRTQLYGSLDLVGLQAGTLGDPGDQNSYGSVGGSITAGNITAVGGLQVLGTSNFSQGIGIDNGGLSITNGSLALGSAGASGVNGLLVFKNSTNSNTVSIVSGVTTAVAGSGYTLTLPTGLPGSTQCLASTSTGTLLFTSCGGGGAFTVVLSPEYPSTVLEPSSSGNNIGTLTSDFCSGTRLLSVNTSVCAATDQHHYFSWTANATNDYDIWTQWQVPNDLSSWGSTPVSLYGWDTTSTSDYATITVYKKGSGTACGTATDSSGGGSTWHSINITSLSGCGTPVAGDVLEIKVNVKVGVNNDFTRVGEITLSYNK
jgi:hypothetical protein